MTYLGDFLAGAGLGPWEGSRGGLLASLGRLSLRRTVSPTVHSLQSLHDACEGNRGSSSLSAQHQCSGEHGGLLGHRYSILTAH